MTDVVRRAAQAASELTVTEEVFAQLRAAIIEKWSSTGVDQVETREKMFLSVQAVDAVRSALLRAVADGQLELSARETAELLSRAEGDRT